jgi:phage N-6-adenine-methyltransferase
VKSRRCIRCRNPLPPQQTGRRRRYCSDACRQAGYRRRRKIPVYHQCGGTDDWPTRPEVFDPLHNEFNFTLDVCATAENAKCPQFYTPAEDGLAQPWTGRVWCNPPYGRGVEKWIQKGYEAVQSGEAELVVFLIPSRTDASWWHQWCILGEIRFFKGRLHFGEGKYGSPFPSALVVFRNASARYETPSAARYETTPAESIAEAS